MRTPIGINTLATAVKLLYEKAGINGYKTNHSLRVIAATRLFHAGLDEQLVMERTGHRSTDGVQVHKRSCVEQQEDVSRILNWEKLLPSQPLAQKISDLNLIPLSSFSCQHQEVNVMTTALFKCSEKGNEPSQPILPSISFMECTGINYKIEKKRHLIAWL